MLVFVTVPPPVRPANCDDDLFSNVPPDWTLRVALLKRILAPEVETPRKPPLATLSVPPKLVTPV